MDILAATTHLASCSVPPLSKQLPRATRVSSFGVKNVPVTRKGTPWLCASSLELHVWLLVAVNNATYARPFSSEACWTPSQGAPPTRKRRNSDGHLKRPKVSIPSPARSNSLKWRQIMSWLPGRASFWKVHSAVRESRYLAERFRCNSTMYCVTSASTSAVMFNSVCSSHVRVK